MVMTSELSDFGQEITVLLHKPEILSDKMPTAVTFQDDSGL